jgi:hypothetical protein
MNSRNLDPISACSSRAFYFSYGGSIMAARSIHLAVTASAMIAGAAALLPAQAQVQVITPVPVQSSQVIIAPSAPPAPRMEAIPAPPGAEAQSMFWRPGHWMWSGANWAWQPGEYVARPQPTAVWEPGHWSPRPDGGYVWVDGHWQG